MNIKKLSTILLVMSLFLFLPLTRPSVEVTLVPFRTEQVVVNIQTESVTVESNVGVPVELNVSYMNPQTNSYELIMNIFFNLEIELDLTDYNRGNYLFELESTRIATINIDQNNVSIPTLSIFGSLLAFRLLIYAKDQYSIDLEY